MLKKLFIWCTAILFVLPVCFAADLDAPAQKQITVRSEIQRGNDAIDNAFWGVFGVLNKLNTFDRVLSRNNQNNTDTDAFLLGAYWAATWRLNLEMNFDGNTKEEKQLAKERFISYYKIFREKQQFLGLDDKQFCESLKMIYDNVKKDLDKWDTQVNGIAASK